ncbi:hypothetical protein J2X31_003630 [Flavobacterium arsenatis]|uniref:Uncharacterized protein n=1 Tax=Flavobacterium arsenatis TaxID=1484332 RepID=A0ABU1TUP8_9FLAO|nr:hypothetical protein [Flavobacterium arsenatis]MDR6969597.1 hypothetical protein [Flavobacterium arsenatis]
MSSTVLVNNVQMDKAIIYDLLIQNKKLEAVKFVMEKSGIDMQSAKDIVELFQDKTINNFDGKDVYKELFQSQSNSNQNPVKPLKSKFFKKALIFIGVFSLVIFLFLKYYIGFQHVETHWKDLQSLLFDNQNPSRQTEEAQIAGTTDVVQEAIESPIDTLMWVNAIKNNDYIPDGVLEEIERYKKRDFSKLVVAEDVPTDKEAEEAIVHHYKNEVVSLLQRENAHIRIGVCYKAPLQPTEIARVTAMVSAFNKTQGNLGNIQMPLDVIYDFVKFQSDPNTWYITDFSQNIPYDYKLNKDR